MAIQQSDLPRETDRGTIWNDRGLDESILRIITARSCCTNAFELLIAACSRDCSG